MSKAKTPSNRGDKMSPVTGVTSSPFRDGSVEQLATDEVLEKRIWKIAIAISHLSDEEILWLCSQAEIQASVPRRPET